MKPIEPKSPLYFAAWYVTSACIFLLLPSWKFEIPLWQLPQEKLIPFAALAIAFFVSAGAVVSFQTMHRTLGLALTTIVTLATFGIVFLGFIVTRTDFSRATIVIASLYAVVLIPMPYLVGASSRNRAIALVVLLVAGISTPFLPSSRPAQRHTSALIKSEYYNLDVETYSDVFPKSSIVGGGLARIGDSYLRLSGNGHLYVFQWKRNADHLEARQLPYRVPINGDEFAASTDHPWETPQADGIPEGQKTDFSPKYLHTEWFRTHGLLTQEIGSHIRIFVSHDYWKADQKCWVERISVLDANRAAVLDGERGPEWSTLYETTPCLPIEGEARRRGVAFVGYFGGGRMALLDPQTLLLTVGDFGFDGVASLSTPSQDPNVSYGKTLAINIANGHASVFTLGHRNPEGLFIDHTGTIWSTEHGPQGGDELNRLVRGNNYGWPYVTYGTDYGSFSWPLKTISAEQNVQAPIFAWVPSIGVSSLVEVESNLFPQWRGDLLIGSLRAQTLFRTRIHDGQVAYLEPIQLGSRIRDLVEGPDGSIAIITDAELVDFITPQNNKSGEGLFAEKCLGCHNAKPNSEQKIGPNLNNVVGRRVATLGNYYGYSSALRSIGGIWTEARLNEFIKSPHDFISGTAMDYAGDADDTERSAIIGYLKGL